MKETKGIYVGKGDKWNLCEFESLNEFYDYVCKTPLNETFRWRSNLSSSKKEHGWKTGWYMSKSFDEASELFKNGWNAGAEELTKRLNAVKSKAEVDKAFKNVLDVCGYQAIVPLYLQGVPNSMVNKRLVPVKQKVITINKMLSASSCVKAETMKQESIKCFQIIKKIEQSGIRVNLNLLISTGHVCAKIRLKSAGERLNVSKLAFPLVHPSMFRRLYFRFIETYPTIPQSYAYGYGTVPDESKFKAVCGENEIMLPTLLGGNKEEEIKKLSVDELIERLK